MYRNPISRTDPSGHACVEGTSYCVDSSTGRRSGSLSSYNDSSNLSSRLDGKVGDKPSKEADGDFETSTVENENIIDVLNLDSVFINPLNPFAVNFQPCQVDTNGGCRIVPQKYRLVYSFYLSQDQQAQLAWDIFGLAASLIGLKEVQSAIKLPQVVGTYTSGGVTLASGFDSARNREFGSAIITLVAGIEPHVSVGFSITLVGKDLSGGWEKTLVSNSELLAGPPTGPYCNGIYDC